MMVKFGGIFVLFLTIFVQSGLAINCYSCNSTDTCGLQYNETTNNFPVQNCSLSTSKCITQLYEVTANGNDDKPGIHTIRGCYEDLINNTCDPNIEKCRLCEGSDKCNNEALGGVRMQCLKCSGTDCNATTPIQSLCDVLPGFEAPFIFEQNCITLFDKGGKVSERGCYGDYPMITRNKCDDANNVDCVKCKDSHNCNTHKERNANKCYRCSGQECMKPTTSTPQVICSKGTASENFSIDCFVGTDNLGQFVRDCKHNITNSANLTKCSTLETQNENSTCITCSGELCNDQTFPIKKELSCYTCKDNCPVNPVDPNASLACNNSISNEECVTVFSETDGKVIERGCSSSITAQTCDTNICRRCSTKDCNIQISQAIQCLSCKSNETANCVYNTSLTGLESISCNRDCFTKIDGKILFRGCLDKTDNCASETCKSCGFNNCNKDQFPSDRLSCYKCNGNDCANNQRKEPCVDYLKDDQCYSKFNEYTISKKGCQSDLNSVDLKNCTDSPTTCNLCNGTNCNSYNTRTDEKCIVCNSRTSTDCAQQPSKLAQSQCDKMSDGKCFTALSGMYVVRRCYSDINTEGISLNETEICSGVGCNNKIYPENRLQCYQCNSNKDDGCKNQQTNTALSIPCVNYQKEDRCFSIINDADEFHRGCTSSVLGDVCGKTKKCQTCTGNACNSLSEKSLNSSAMHKVNAFVILILLFVISRLR